MYDGLDALVRGALAGAALVVPAVAAFWLLTARLGAGPRALRPFVACCAAYGAVAGAGTAWVHANFRVGLLTDALTGLLVAGAAAMPVAFLTLLLFPRGSSAPPTLPPR